MDTERVQILASIAIVLVLAAAFTVGRLTVRDHDRDRQFRLPIVTLVIASVIAITSTVGNLNPTFLHLLGRDGYRLSQGELWRLISPLLVQDGGWPGTIFNVVALVAVGTVVETLFRRPTVIVVFLVTGVIGEIAAYTVLQGQGFAGNSVANLGLATMVLVVALFAKLRSALIVAIVGLLAGLPLIFTVDLHGVGLEVGAIFGLLLAYQAKSSSKNEVPE